MQNMAKIRKMLLLLTLLFCLSGRVYAVPVQDAHIVTGVDVQYRRQDATLQLHYSQTGKMEAILNYLRLLEYDGLPNHDPELHRGDRCRITLRLAGGGERIYYLLDDRYVSRDLHPWERIVPPQALLSLLESLPADG